MKMKPKHYQRRTVNTNTSLKDKKKKAFHFSTTAGGSSHR
jgi:hypothetical protein